MASLHMYDLWDKDACPVQRAVDFSAVHKESQLLPCVHKSSQRLTLLCWVAAQKCHQETKKETLREGLL